MARLLVATVPLTGHVHPMAPLVAELVARGHDVRWTTGQKFAPTVARTGARFVAMRAARDWDDADLEAAFPALAGTRGLARVKRQLIEMFIAPMVDQLRDLEALAPADAVLADSAHLGAGLFAERHRVPWFGLGISALMVPSVDTAPFGSAQPPDRAGPAGNRFLNWLIFRVVFARVNRHYRRMRVAAGLPAGDATYFDAMAPDLFLQPTVPAFEYPRRDLPAQVRFIGPLPPPAGASQPLPAWWGDLDAAARAGRPIVLVTQGTLATDPRELIAPALRGLADHDALVVATTGRPVELADVPANARVAAYVPYGQLLPRVSVMVTNGGYGGVQQALAHGVPLVVAGGSEEKPEIAARVAWSGAGVDLRTGRPRPAKLRAAVARVLGEPGFRERARALADAIAGHDAPRLGADLIEAALARREEYARAS
jgi:MGT family glycosyltransferase